MDCPVCKNAMVVLELRDVEIDHCFGCGGIWLDAGELELLIDDAQKAADLLKSFEIERNSTETPRKCPICFKKMEKVVVGCEKPHLLIDRCHKNHGLWFDSGELHEIMDKAKLDQDSKIKQILSEMFGEEKKEIRNPKP